MPPKTSVPQVSTNEKALRRWLKKVGVDPNAPNSEIQTTAPANERRKKQKLDTSRGNQQQQTKTVGDAMGTNLDIPPAKTTEGEGLTSDHSMPSSANHPQGSRPPPQPQACGNTQTQTSGHTSSEPQGSITSIPADRWWCLFNNFKGVEGSDITSIFDHRFPVEQVVGREFNKKEDIARVNKTIASLEKSLLEAKTKLTTTEAKKMAAKTRCLEFETKYSDVVVEQVKLKKDFDDKEVAILHAQGFHKAIDQVKLLNLGVNVEGVGVFKKIVDGKLVEESEDDEE
ncbi:hypothetical protein SESBI_14222 [Sesbania bispinosa]|nr:hypothetical protein SESBI_14222 [Sesbania bispinosa]